MKRLGSRRSHRSMELAWERWTTLIRSTIRSTVAQGQGILRFRPRRTTRECTTRCSGRCSLHPARWDWRRWTIPAPFHTSINVDANRPLQPVAGVGRDHVCPFSVDDFE
jgi:hypothetical protein